METDEQRPSAGARRPALRPFPVVAAAAVLALIATVLLGSRLGTVEERLDQERARARAIKQVLAAPDSRTTGERFPGGGSISVVLSPQLQRAVVTVTGLGEPPGGKDHQLWLGGRGELRSPGLLEGDEPLVAGHLDACVTSLFVTVEPGGGSPAPTGGLLFQLALEPGIFGNRPASPLPCR
ncbi:anti-sigma factor [Streptomyces sp. KLOTTS4A1]|uniref:anti-sigma factor n=1 Tax=Streptomyces sp. KLOTTS4A1 TaxID=3390996 RepID=UPI0039F5D809